MDRAREALDFARRGAQAGDRQLVFIRSAVKLLSPLPRPRPMRITKSCGYSVLT